MSVAAARVARLPHQRSAVPATPSSLVKVPDVSRPRCSACGSTRLMQIAMTLTDGTPVQFTSCRDCEHKAWRDGSRELPVESVLTKATKQK